MKFQFGNRKDILDYLWKRGQKGCSLLSAYSAMVDDVLVSCLEAAGLEDMKNSFVIVALGEYGRKELFPFSDIDCMVLCKETSVGGVEDFVTETRQPFRDTGVDLACRVNTVAGSLAQAQQDYFFRISLIDMRYVAGSKSLYQELQKQYGVRFVSGKREDFVRTMLGFCEERWEKSGSHSYLLEPYIDEGKGGLQDIQAMMWISQVVFGLNGLKEIADAGLLTREEQNDFQQSWDVLIQLRNCLHYLSGKKNDRLVFDQQEQMAEIFGYEDSGAMSAVECFMCQVYSHLQKIAVVTDLFFNHVEEILGLGGSAIERIPDRTVEKGVEIRDNRIRLVLSARELQKRPHVLMRLFLTAARTGVPVHYRTLRLVTQNRGLISAKIRCSARMSKAFQSIFIEAKDVLAVLESMHETGLLQAYIPEFARIEALPQYDSCHIYTVDRHSLQVVAELSEIIQKEVVATVPVNRLNIVFLAALLHDIGRRSGQDHAEYGAELAGNVARRLGLADFETETLVFLVRHYLFIQDNARQHDLEDVLFIRHCAEKIGSAERLSMLYLLSVADAKATGPAVWNEWKASLLLELFLKIKHYFDGKIIAFSHGAVAGNQSGIGLLREQIRLQLQGQEGMASLVDLLPANYLVNFTPEKIVDHLHFHDENYSVIRQKAFVHVTDNGKYWSVLIMAVDQSGLLAKISGVMALENLDIINGYIFVWGDGTVVCVVDVCDADGLAFFEKDWLQFEEKLDMAIAGRLGLGYRLYSKLYAACDSFDVGSGSEKPVVTIDNDLSAEYTVVKVYALNMIGQLYRIAQALADFGIIMREAFVVTEGKRLVDTFYVLDNQNQKIMDVDFQEEVVQGVLHSVMHNGGR